MELQWKRKGKWRSSRIELGNPIVTITSRKKIVQIDLRLCSITKSSQSVQELLIVDDTVVHQFKTTDRDAVLRTLRTHKTLISLNVKELIEAVECPIIIVTEHERIIYQNGSALQLLGEQYGKTITKVIPDPTGQLLRIHTVLITGGNKILSIEKHVSERSFQNSTVPTASLLDQISILRIQNAMLSSNLDAKSSPRLLDRYSSKHLFVDRDPRNHFIFGDVIGKGSFGVVYLAHERQTGRKVAVKKLTLPYNDVKAELYNLARFEHDNIIRYLGCYGVDPTIHQGIPQNETWIVTEYCNRGSLLDRMSSHRFSIDQICAILKQILKALKYIHFKGAIHRDIKPGNILLTSKGYVKIADFGTSWTRTRSKDKANSMVGTVHYMSPERLNDSEYDQKSDIWSLGIVLIELVEGPTLLSKSRFEMMCSVSRGDAPIIDETKYTPELLEFLQSCLRPVAKRPTAIKLLKTDLMKRVSEPQQQLRKLWT
jgi:hypothetical protein